ncbi:hypothetical protein [Bradyrhizobium ivorense]|uniref:hypothetical protein n=1 Tax=Bradyrhizobium ivorense TaxID=2511166 RepID=UPI0010B38DB2|nr:hypothetical protein [Bradyrhizobium ivorense]VIO81187.1 hypothetical protein CI41S_78390 [Bradyrhizobium ivorense]
MMAPPLRGVGIAVIITCGLVAPSASERPQAWERVLERITAELVRVTAGARDLMCRQGRD